MENNQAVAKVGSVNSDLARALSTPQIRYVDRFILEGVIQPAVFSALMDRGQFEIDQEKIDHLVSSLGESILKSCPNIRIDEIPIAIKRGTLGDFGEYHGINVVSLVGFLKSHLASPERLGLTKVSSSCSGEVKKLPSEAETLKFDKELLVNAFEKFKKIGFYEDHGNYLYKVAAKKLKLFELSEDRKKDFLLKGKAMAIEKIRSDIMRFPNQRNKLLAEVKEANELTPASDGIKKVYKDALQLALNDWFLGLIEMDSSISDLLK